MIRTAFLALLCTLPGCFGNCDGGTTPSSETCEAGAALGVITDVDIGRYVDGAFTQYQEGDVVPLIYGGQGFPMLVFNLRLRGSDLPDCMPQVTRVRRGDEIDGSEALPLVTEQVLPDTWITGDLLIVTFDVSPGSYVTVESEVGAVGTAVGVWVDFEGVLPDAAVMADAAPVADAAWVPDAAPVPDAAAATP